MKRLLLILLAISVAACESPSTPASPTPAECPPVEVVDGVNVIPEGAPAECVYIQGLPFDQPSIPVGRPQNWDTKWNDAVRVNGFGTRYDAYQHARSWYDAPKTWIYASSKECKKNPAWKCYRRNMGGWTALVRPWSTTLDNMYAALGPRLRRYLSLPAWHTIPTQKLLIISTHTGKSVEVWIADYCACHGADKKQGTRDDSLIDLSPEVWAALGAYKGGKIPKWPYANTTPGFKNTIEVRFLP